MKRIATLIIFVFFMFAYYGQGQTPKLIAYWPFDDGTANDASGNGYNGILKNACTFITSRAGKGKALHLEGYGINDSTGAHVLLPSIPFSKYKEFTLSMWVKEYSSTYFYGEAFISFGDHNAGWLGIMNHVKQPYSGDNTLYLHFSVGAKMTDNPDQIDPLFYQYNMAWEWSHYTISFKDGYMKCYVNNDLVCQDSQKVNIAREAGAIGRHWWGKGVGADFTSSRLVADIDEVKIFDKALTPKEVEDMETDTVGCHPSSFEYKALADASNLKLLGMANVTNSSVELTNLHQFASGAIWYDKKVPVKKGFSTEFSFFLSNGTNNDVVESTLPGADGIALVIQNSGTNLLGLAGGGIGYEGIRNGVALEIDSYINKERNDPENDHVGLMTCGINGEISSDHGSKTCLGAANLVNPALNAVHDKYYCKVVYSEPYHQLTAYLDKTGEFKSPVMVVDNFDITKYMSLANDEFAYIGITSATGSAAERHWISSWKACFKNTTTILSNHDEIGAIAGNELRIVPNPAESAVSIRFKSAPGEEYLLNIYDILGNNVYSSNFRANTELSSINWNPANSTARGVYNCVVSSGNKVLSAAVMLK